MKPMVLALIASWLPPSRMGLSHRSRIDLKATARAATVQFAGIRAGGKRSVPEIHEGAQFAGFAYGPLRLIPRVIV
jgi:hypothetical protein